jgi:hypothetical protein
MTVRNVDFAATRVMQFAELPAAQRKSDRLAWFDCGCRVPRLARAPRSTWMHFLPGVRLYKCGVCGAKVLRRTLPRAPAYPVERLYRSPRRAMAVARPPAYPTQIVRTPMVQIVVDANTMPGLSIR